MNVPLFYLFFQIFFFNRFEVLVTLRLHLPLSPFPHEVLHFVPHTLKGGIFEDELEGWGACKQFLDLVISWAFLIRLKSVQDGVSVLQKPLLFQLCLLQVYSGLHHCQTGESR